MRIRTMGVALALLCASVVGLADESTLTGTWNLTIESPQGKRTPRLMLTQTGSTLTGTYHSQMGEAPVSGKVTGSEFALDVKMARQGQEMVFAYKGTVTGTDMKGMLSMGRMGDVPFKGVKAQP